MPRFSGTTVINCSLGSLPGGTSTSITIMVTTGAAGILTNNASVGAAELDSTHQTAVTNSLVRAVRE